MSSPMVRSTSATRSVSGWPSRLRSRCSSAPSRSSRRCPSGENPAGGPGSASASISVAVSMSSPADASNMAARTASLASAGGSAAPRTAEHAGPAGQRLQVRGAELPSRSGEHPHRRGPGRRVDEQPQHRDQVGDLGFVQQTTETDHLDRDAAGRQRRDDAGHVASAAEQHGGGRRCRAPIGPGGFDLLGNPFVLVDHRVEQAVTHRSPAGRPTRGARPGTLRRRPDRRRWTAPARRPRRCWPTRARRPGCGSSSAGSAAARWRRRASESRW